MENERLVECSLTIRVPPVPMVAGGIAKVISLMERMIMEGFQKLGKAPGYKRTIKEGNTATLVFEGPADYVENARRWVETGTGMSGEFGILGQKRTHWVFKKQLQTAERIGFLFSWDWPEVKGPLDEKTQKATT
jgi:hypothetical protein